MEASPEIVEMHAIFSGRVQGVGFRMTVKYHATSLKLRGMVRNLPDGRVETHVQGKQNKLEELLSRINSQTGAASVDSIETHFGPVAHPYLDFRVSY